MLTKLKQKRIVLGITGGIAAYKSLELVRLLRKAGAEVQVVLTEHATHFVTPLSLQAVSGRIVRTHLFDTEAERAMSHIELARWAEMIVIAPASADTIAKLAHGFCEDLLTTLCLASDAKRYIAPAMNERMWHKPVTQANIMALQQQYYHCLEPEVGEQACGDHGIGRMMEPSNILQQLLVTQNEVVSPAEDISVLITAGATQEAIDPVRYISNHSSGKMGYALAEAWQRAGAKVHLITAPTHLAVPAGVECTPVTTALEMQAEVHLRLAQHCIFISVAAVADYRVEVIALQKLHKTTERLTLDLIQNPDIVRTVVESQQCPFVIAFAAETEEVLPRARVKMQRKGVQMLIANQVGDGLGFNAEENEVWVLTAKEELHLPRQNKTALAPQLVQLMINAYRKKTDVI